MIRAAVAAAVAMPGPRVGFLDGEPLAVQTRSCWPALAIDDRHRHQWLLALFNRQESVDEATADVVAAETEPMVVSPYMIAELDYLVATRLGVEAELTVLRELAAGCVPPGVALCRRPVQSRKLSDRYQDQAIGVADASLTCRPTATVPGRS